MWDVLQDVISLAIGILLIVFRKSFVKSLLKGQLKKATIEQKKQYKQLEEMGYSAFLYKVYITAVIICGGLSIAFGLFGLFGLIQRG